MKSKKKKHRYENGGLKPGGKLNPKDCSNMTKAQKHGFIKAARDKRKQKKNNFQVGRMMDFKIGEAGVNRRYVKSLFSSLG